MVAQRDKQLPYGSNIEFKYITGNAAEIKVWNKCWSLHGSEDHKNHK